MDSKGAVVHSSRKGLHKSKSIFALAILYTPTHTHKKPTRQNMLLIARTLTCARSPLSSAHRKHITGQRMRTNTDARRRTQHNRLHAKCCLVCMKCRRYRHGVLTLFGPSRARQGRSDADADVKVHYSARKAACACASVHVLRMPPPWQYVRWPPRHLLFARARDCALCIIICSLEHTMYSA